MSWQYWFSVAITAASAAAATATVTASAAATAAAATTVTASAAAATAAGTASATATAGTASAAATAAASSAPTASVRSRFSLIDIDEASLQILAVQLFDCFFGFLLRRHFNESKSFGLAAVLVLYDVGVINFAKRCKSLSQIIFCCLRRQISNIDIHFVFLFKIFTATLSGRTQSTKQPTIYYP
jgi:hypothetical protein